MLQSAESSPEAISTAESPQLSLLQQIKLVRIDWRLLIWILATLTLFGTIVCPQKQSRLRHVEPQVPRKQSLPTGPFATSIARILERRSSIGYDSDSSDSQKSSGGNDW